MEFFGSLKIPTKSGVVPQSFYQNQNPDQDQDHNFTLDFNTRTKFFYIEHTHQIFFGSTNSCENYCVYSQKSTYVQTDRQTDFFSCFEF